MIHKLEMLALIVPRLPPDCWAEERSRDHCVHARENDWHVGGQQRWVHARTPPTTSTTLLWCWSDVMCLDDICHNTLHDLLNKCIHESSPVPLTKLSTLSDHLWAQSYLHKTVVCFLKIRARAGRWTWRLRGSSNSKPEWTKMMCIVTFIRMCSLSLFSQSKMLSQVFFSLFFYFAQRCYSKCTDTLYNF